MEQGFSVAASVFRDLVCRVVQCLGLICFRIVGMRKQETGFWDGGLQEMFCAAFGHIVFVVLGSLRMYIGL